MVVMEKKESLVIVRSNEVFADSRTIAEKFKKQHRNVLKKIDQLRKDLAELDAPNGAPKKDEELEVFREKTHFYKGQNFRYFEMNRPAFSLLVLGFTGKKALIVRRAFNKAFYDMERMLLNHSNLEWLRSREQGKQVRLEMTDAVKHFVEYATRQGSKNAKMYYANLTVMTYKALGLIEKNEKVRNEFRNKLDQMDLFILTSAERVAQKTLLEGMELGLHYKEIYQLAKQKVIVLADIMIIKPRSKQLN